MLGTRHRLECWLIVLAVGISGCSANSASNNFATDQGHVAPPKQAVNAPLNQQRGRQLAEPSIAPSKHQSTQVPSVVTAGKNTLPTQSQSAGRSAQIAMNKSRNAAPNRPKRAIIQYVTQFQMPSVLVLDKAYGKRKGKFKNDAFPKIAIPNTQYKGVPVYDRDGAYIEVLLPNGQTGWVSQAVTQLSAKPCATVGGPKSTNKRGAPVSAGAGQFSC